MKRLAIIIVASMMGLFLTGCREDKDNNDVNKQANADEKVTITIMSSTITESPEGDIEQEFANEYMKLNSNVEIKYMGVSSNDLAQRIITLATTDSLPDAFHNLPQFQATSREMDIITPINELVSPEYINGFLETAIVNNRIDGDLVVLPRYAIPPSIVYRTDWLKELRMEEPKNWDAFLEVAKAMTKDTIGDGKIDQYGFSMIGTRNASGAARFIMIVRNFGVDDITMENGKYGSELSSDNYQKALQFFTDLSKKHKVVPPGPTEAGYPEAVNYFATGKTGMILTGSNAIGAIIAQNPKLDGKLGSFPVPAGTRAVNFIPTEGYSVSKSSKHKDIVVDYLKFLSNKENSIKFAQKTGRMPVRIEATGDAFFEADIFKGFITAINNPYYAVNFPRYEEVFDIVGESYSTVMANNITVVQAIEKLTKRLTELLDEVNP